MYGFDEAKNGQEAFTMMKTTVALLAASLLAQGVMAQVEPTHFRKHHTLHIEATAGRELTIEVACIAASVGYADPLVYSMFGPTGHTDAHGSIQPGAGETIKLTPEADGIYIFDGDPGMNAFTVQVTGGVWAVSTAESRVINVIGHANPLHFHVPEGMDSITLGFNGEAASIKLLRPDGSEAATRALENYEKASVTVDSAGQPGWWRLELDLREDQGISLPAGIAPFVAEAPLSDEMLHAWLSGKVIAQFDLRPTPPVQLQGRPGMAKHELATDDGLTLGLADDGRVVSAQLDGAELLAGEDTPLAGFFARDVAAGSDLTVFEGGRDRDEPARGRPSGDRLLRAAVSGREPRLVGRCYRHPRGGHQCDFRGVRKLRGGSEWQALVIPVRVRGRRRGPRARHTDGPPDLPPNRGQRGQPTAIPRSGPGAHRGHHQVPESGELQLRDLPLRRTLGPAVRCGTLLRDLPGPVRKAHGA
jgi:hypothetical protein